ncbi:hypothetical protein EI77_01542 [Prosthecobacter fusiformis]|uniref:Uncharacterized protein n=1 Tax=Prosthecobacter fusiformis TaxID=48464 RepID=A0A4R7S6K3_9BACT|nr:hypothetical protein [Prosthecobacter fusiformis]TDU73075.1 hypothetical protein EI77_01542 [Prosthecobacter fusiformis]
MSKHKHEEQELPFVALMDTMTNVVGVLIIVMVMVGISLAAAVNKILSDLPPVTEEQHKEMVEKIKQLPPLPQDPKKLEEDQKIAEIELQKVTEELSKIDTTSVAKQMEFMDLDSFRKKLDEAKKKREEEKAKTDAMLAELERLKSLLDETPVYTPPAPTFVRLPNPRPYPAEPNETRVLVARQGVLFLNDEAFIKPIIDGLEKVKSQLEYKEVRIDPFLPMLTKVFGTAPAAQQAWPEISPLAGNFQMDQVAVAYKDLAAAGLQPNKAVLGALGDIAVTLKSSLPAVTTAVIAATKADLSKWTALDPSKDPTKPTIKAAMAGGKINFSYGSKSVEVKAGAKEVLSYFVKDLAGLDSIKNKSRSKVIYDAFKLQAMLERAASSPTLSGSYTIKPTIRPGSTAIQLALTPRAGGGETLDQMRAEGSNYQRLMRQIKGDTQGVAVFQVMADAFDTYLEARKIADDIGVSATWEFLAQLDLSVNVTGYEVQRFNLPTPPAPKKPGAGDPVRIAAPKRSLD